MTQVLNIAGGFIYLALRVVLLPVFILFDIVMGAWLFARWTQRYFHRLTHRIHHKREVYQQHSKKALVLFRAKWNNPTASSH